MNTYYIDKAAERLKKEQEFGHTVQSRSYNKNVQTREKPAFAHPEIEALYVNGMRIDHRVINEILALPRKTLIPDLETVLQDSINRFEYFRDKAKKEGWNEQENNFPPHALFLLAELNAEDSLPSLLTLLRQGEEFLDFWFSDLLTEMVWEIVYHLGQNKLEDLKAFLMEPDLYTFARNTVNKAVSQMALHHPGRASEITDWYADLFEFYLENTDNLRIIDTDLISFMVWYCVDTKAKELIPTIKKLYEHELVNPYMAGSFKEIKKDIMKPGKGYRKKEVLDIYDRYEQILNTWYSYQPQKELQNPGQQETTGTFWDYNNAAFQTFEREIPKVGRNDSCPCGSGRKYKYCCME
ncbi:MAG TPA: DUF1186 domain-containing protein [Fodinibius sp.]|nr:DUF1186 domain-containing protein [Fodinibius sp.]